MKDKKFVFPSIQNKIEEGIFQCHKKMKEASVILMHPQTYEDFQRESLKWCNTNHHVTIYKGVKIFRSLDVIEGEVIVE